MNKTTRQSGIDRGITVKRPVLRWPPHRWALVLVLASLAWRLIRYGLVFPMWGDEAFIAVNFITRSFGELSGPLDHPQIVPVGFLWVQWLASRLLGTSELALRLLPVLAGMVCVLVFWRLAPRMVGRRQAMAAVVIFAASYYPVRHSVEVKSYSLDLLIALCLLWQAWSLMQAPRTPWRWVVFTLCGAAAVWASYPAVFIIGGSMFVLVYQLMQGRKPVPWLAGWVVSGLVMAGSFFAMWQLVAVGQAINHEGIHELRGWASAFPPMDSPVGLVVWFFRSHTGNMLAYPVGGNHGGSTVTFFLIIFGIIAMWRTGHRAALCLLLSPVPLMFLAAALKKYPYGDSARVEQHIAPAACLLAGAGLVALLHHGWKRRGAVTGMQIISVVMLCIITYGVIRDVRQPYKKESDLVSLHTVRGLADRSNAGDQWVVFGSLVDQDQAPNMVPWGGSLARFRYDLLQHGHESRSILWAPMSDDVPVPGPGSVTWLLMYHDNDQETNPFPQEQAKRYLETVKGRLGEPQVETFLLKEDSEEVVIYRFGGVAGNVR
jgi:4-amino-4-deoxy-L-arabinose transferase-like glycosyltransferase